MKKAFCEPGNVEFCPPIALVSVFALRTEDQGSSFVVKRSDENGGDVEFKTIEELEKAFAAGEGTLHPGDLKASTTTVVMGVLEKIAAGLKSDKKAQNAAKALKAFQKKMAKQKKK